MYATLDEADLQEASLRPLGLFVLPNTHRVMMDSGDDG